MNFFLPISDPAFHVTVTQEEFNLFHNIDRQLFTRLVVGLGRDTTKSTHVMAFILWVENKIKNRNIVPNLLKWSDVMLTKLAEEIELVLDCIESSTFPYGYNQKVVPLIQTIMQNAVTLHYFHYNRIEIINATTKLLVEVCLRAFNDIVQQVHYGGFPIIPSMQVQPQAMHNAPRVALVPQQDLGPQAMHNAPRVALVPQQDLGQQWNEANSNTRNINYDVSRQINTNGDISCIFAKLDLDNGLTTDADSVAVMVPVSDDQKRVASIDDRTIFMTFSKGYHISEHEVLEFFIRSYGNVVEAIMMQDVEPPEKPLYARLVIYPEATRMIEHFLGGKNGKIEFAINGKRVWARKFFGRPTNEAAGTSSYFQF